MRVSILRAFTEHAAQLDSDIRAAVEAYCTPEHLQAVIGQQVQQSLDAVIREETDYYFRNGDGRREVRKILQERLSREVDE